MRRWLLVFLLVLMPLQSVWAEAAAYCRHEKLAAGADQHWGHHEHQHSEAGGESHGDAASDTLAASPVDADCGVCHASCAPAMPMQAGVAATPGPAALRVSVPLRTASYAPAPPDRPNWSLPA